MSQREAFLAAIRDEPDDDTHRLVYADWLTDHGNERDIGRAEFIRAQVTAALLPEGEPERKRLEARAAELWANHCTAWFGDLAGEFRDNFDDFRRGFLETLRRSPEFLDKYGAEIFEREPIGSLSLCWDKVPVGEDRMAAWPWLARVRDLDLTTVNLGETRRAKVLRSPLLARLRQLRLDLRNLGTEQIEALEVNPALAGLTCLVIEAMWPTGDPIADALAQVQNLPRLTHLVFGSQGVGPKGAAALARASILRNLTCLAFQLDNIANSQRPVLGDTGLATLLGSPHLPQLTDLTVEGQDLTDAAVIALAESPRLARLARLSLRRNSIGADGAAALGASPHLGQLEELDLSNTALGDAGIEALARGTALGRLRWLNVKGVPSIPRHDNGIGDRGLVALAVSPILAGVRVLNLAGNAGIGPAGIRALAGSPHLAQLEELNLDGCPILADGARALAASPIFAGVRRLSLRWTKIGDTGAKALAKSLHLGRLRTLLLWDCDLHAAGARALAESPHLRGVTYLDLDRNQLSESLRQALERK
jgi:uncharacterized protein (TIGR02996 family)